MQRALRPGAVRAARPRHARIAGAAVLVACLGLSLTGCRSAPTAAAYVGSHQFTEKQVDAVIYDAEAAAEKENGTHAPTRSDVVTTMVLTEVCHRTQAKKGFTAGNFGVDQVKQRERVPAHSEYAVQRSAMFSCLIGVPVGQTEEPTDQELQAIYDRAKASRLVNVPFEQIKPQLAADTGVRQAITVTRVLTAMVRDGDVVVNPRYRPLEFGISDLGSGVMLINLPISKPGTDSTSDLG
jgi:hypothetical protein